MTGESEPRLAPGHRVLVVEDDGLIALSIAELLTDLGAEQVECCARADEALAMIAELRPTVVILDAGLADRDDGWAIAELVLQIAASPPAIVFATGSPGAIPEHVARHGQVLAKPFSEAALASAVFGALERPGLLDRLRRTLGT